MSTSEVRGAVADTGTDPAVTAILRSLAPEEVDMLRDAFIYMDHDSDGYVNVEEMMAKVSACVGPERFAPLQEYLVPLFHVADKDGDGCLSLTEFLMSFADGPGVVPAEVINSCVADVRVRLTDEEMSTLQDNFRRIDANQDGVVDAEELEAALRAHLLTKFPDLTGENFKEIVAVVLASADADRDGVLSLSEFIRSYQEDQGVLPATFLEAGDDRLGGVRQLTDDETTVLREAFAVLDRNDDGFVDVEDLYSALWDTLGSGTEDQNQIRDLCDLIMMTADRSKRGHLTVTDFIRGFLQNVQLMQIPVAVAQERVRVACDKLQDMHNSGELEKLVMVFEDLDRDGDGYVARSEMVNVLKTLFRDAFPGWDDEMLTSVMTAIVVGAETNSGSRLSLEEFIRSFVEGPGVLPPEAVQTWGNNASGTRRLSTSTPAAAFASVRQRRWSAATDGDLQRIGDAVRAVHAKESADGSISREALRACIAERYLDDPQHGEEMFSYALQQFVRTRADGRLVWSENVSIEDNAVEEGGESGGRDSRFNAGTPPQPATSSAQDSSPDEQTSPKRLPTSVASPAAAAGASASKVKAEMNVASLGAGNSVSSSSEGMKTQPKTLSVPRSMYATPKASSKRTTASTTMNKGSMNDYRDVSGNPYFDDDLKRAFASYDVEHKGYLEREAFKKVYEQMESFGLQPSAGEIDRRFRRYSYGSDKVYFDEFCILMLQRARM